MARTLRLVFMIVAPWIIAVPAWAACGGTSPTLTAASAAQVDVNDCLRVAVNGDTITVPAGTATWTSTLTISKFVKLIASGTVEIIDNMTVIPGASTSNLLNVVESSAGSVLIQGFTFVQGMAVHANPNGVIRLNSGGAGARPILITGNAYHMNTTSGDFIIAGTNQGVIWNNTQTGLRAGGSCANNASFVRHKPISDTTSWTRPSTFGAADTTGTANLYVETNTVINVAEGLDTDSFGRTVFRYNTFTNSGITLHGVDTSGNYGARYVDLYSNAFVLDQTPIATCGNLPANVNGWIHVRGGTALIHNNVLPPIAGQAWGTKTPVMFSVEELRRNSGGFPCWSTITAPGSGYPAPQQPGWGFVSGRTIVSGSQCTNCPMPQDIEPIYLWGNTGGGNYDSPYALDYDCSAGDACPNCSSCPRVSDYIRANREYYVATPKPGYEPYQYPHPLTGSSLGAPGDLRVR